MVRGRCLRLLTEYSYVISNAVGGNGMSDEGISYTKALDMAQYVGGELARLDASMFEGVKQLLILWHHEPELGNIWIGSGSENTKSIIMVC